MFTSAVGHSGVPTQAAPSQACKVRDRSVGRYDTLPVDTALPPSQVCRDRCIAFGQVDRLLTPYLLTQNSLPAGCAETGI